MKRDLASQETLSTGALAACYGKQAFETESLERAVAKRKKRGHSYEHYKCSKCGHWHVGNHTGHTQNKKKDAAKSTGSHDAEQ